MNRREVKKHEIRQAAIIKNSIRRRRKRRRLKIQFYLALLFIFLSIIGVLAYTVLFPAKKITVMGECKYNAVEIIEVSEIKIGKSIFQIDTNAVKSRIETRLTYIETAKVSRKLPFEVLIEVSAAVPRYACKFEGSYLLASETGKILEIVADKPEGVTIISGLKLNNPKSGHYIEFLDMDQKYVFDQLKQGISSRLLDINFIDLSDIVDIQLIYENRILINLGSSIDLDYKLAHVAAVLKELDQSEEGTLNLKYWAENNQQSFFKKEKIDISY
ncbi:MAG TPA: FtsQ-type POTRA domain-containing protein [Clostridiales bacterium]|nr:FtsQ-type POTRA domain-containing protein [Clostridiales bacterium]